jgi:hypothetical protein
MSFWTKDYSQAGVTNPKRDFRFRVQFTNIDQYAEELEGTYLWYAKTADKPSFTLGESTHSYLNHTFKFPGRVTWNDVSIAMVDPGGNKGLAYGLTLLLKNSGYTIPQGAANNTDFATISKSSAVSAIGDVIVEQLDEDGNALEKWILYNAFISDVKYGTLDYSSDNLTEYTVALRYDWAAYDTEGSAVDFSA